MRALLLELLPAGAKNKLSAAQTKALVTATGSVLLEHHGIGPSGVARLLVEVGDQPVP